MTRPSFYLHALQPMLLASVFLVGCAHAEPTPEAPAPQVVTITRDHSCSEPPPDIALDVLIQYDFDATTLGELTKIMRCLTQQNFLLTRGVNRAATVGVRGRTAMTIYEAYQDYVRMLESNGLGLSPNRQFIEVMPADQVPPRVIPSHGPCSPTRPR